ncbi:Retrovirus-related Pol polyprotein from transposon opus [Dictyocoela muelleri]|nr:Retrovirus-related Pol polyprotein from transposon opus [Dictyocoela muelleri]
MNNEKYKANKKSDDIRNYDTKHIETKGENFCKYHKTNTHNTDECFKIKEKEKTKKEEKNLIVNEKHSNDQLLYLDGKIECNKVECLIDTGSNRSAISLNAIEKLQLKTQKMNEIQIQTASNIIVAKEMTKSQISFNGIENAFFNIEFIILPNLPVDIIIGNNFSRQNEAMICLQTNTIRLMNFTINLNLKKRQKTNILYQIDVERLKNKVNELVITSDIGKYKKLAHEIHLLSMPKITYKQYPVPFSIRSEAKLHIENLLEKNVIRKSNSPFCSPAFFISKPNK